MKYFTFVACLVIAISIQIEGCDKVTTPQLVWNGNKAYHFATYSKMNWYSAFEYCRYLGMQLAVIDSVDEWKFVVNEIQSSIYDDDSYWTSANDIAKEGTYMWMSTGVTFMKNTTLWYPGQPDNFQGNENCLTLWNRNQKFLFNDAVCTITVYAICEVISEC